jgi:hypothetical protein
MTSNMADPAPATKPLRVLLSEGSSTSAREAVTVLGLSGHIVGGCAGHSLLPAYSGYTTIETKGNFSRPITGDTGRVRAEARVVAQSRQIISAEARLLNRDGKVLAHGTTTIMVLGGVK